MEKEIILECKKCKKWTTLNSLAKKKRCYWCNSKNIEIHEQDTEAKE